MAYIYCITNNINGKQYVGKTNYTIEKRFQEHCRDAKKESKEKRPLYAAMRKYGIENFSISLLEETNQPEQQEKYWIEKLKTFKYGYNATIGGDDKSYLDYDLLINAYKELQSLEAVSNKFKCDTHYLSKILKDNNIYVHSSQEVNQIKQRHIVNQYDLNGNYLNTYSSCLAALRAVHPNNQHKSAVAHITDVCKGKRKTAYGYIWRFADEYNTVRGE